MREKRLILRNGRKNCIRDEDRERGWTPHCISEGLIRVWILF